MRKKKIFKLIFIIVTAYLFVFLAIMIYSFVFPKKSLGTTNIRMPIQKKIMKSLGDQTIDNNYFFSYITREYEIIDKKNNISMDDLSFVIKDLNPGDIFFTNSGKYLSSFFIPGKWKHAAIYLGSKNQLLEFFGEKSEIYKSFSVYYSNPDDILLLDSSSEGVKIRRITDISNLSSTSYLKSISFFRINKQKTDIEIFLKKAYEQVGKDYDYDIDTEDETYIYCSELIYHSLKSINLIIEKEGPFLSRDLISPNDALYYILKESIDNNNFIFILFLEKKNGELQKLSKQDLISEFFQIKLF